MNKADIKTFFLFIGDEFDTMIALKTKLEEKFCYLEIDFAFSIKEGIRLLAKKTYDLILVDIFLQKHKPYVLLKSIRQSCASYIFVVSALTSQVQAVEIYNAGADACLCRSIVSLDIIHAAIKAAYRRITYYQHATEIPGPVVMMNGDLVIDPRDHSVMVGRKSIQLTALEFNLLFFMCSNVNQVLSTRQLYEHVWKDEGDYATAVLNCIARLRKKLEPDPGHPTYISTVYGAGYIFRSPIGE